MLTKQFIDKQKVVLERRLRSKGTILKTRCEQALLHSQNDLTKIRFALRRIETGQYGLCSNCGITIDIKRLHLIPETPFCIKCAPKK